MNKNNDDAFVVKPYSRLVSLTIRPEHVFHFPQGLPAFDGFKNYVFTIKPDTSPFVFMQSIEPAGLSFVCVDPFLIHPEYAPRIGPADQEILRLERPEALMLMCIVTVRSDARDTTANLQGPLVINIENSIGKQILCDGQSYPVRYRIWDAIGTIADEMVAESRPERFDGMQGTMKHAFA